MKVFEIRTEKVTGDYRTLNNEGVSQILQFSKYTQIIISGKHMSLDYAFKISVFCIYSL
jgi:hypothetical protein